MNVQEAIQSFLRHGETQRNLSDRTLRAYESDLVQFRTHLHEREVGEMASVTPGHLEHYVAELGSGPYRETSIRRKVAALKVFFRYLEESGVVDESPARRLKIRQPAEPRLPNVLTMKEIKALLGATQTQIERYAGERHRSPGAANRYFCAVRDSVIIELLFSSGIRIGELVTLDVGDVDLRGRRLSIIGRGTRERYVELGSEIVLEALRYYIALRSERDLDNPALFVGRSGTRLTIYSIENIFKKYVKLADLKRHVTPHALRHTMAAMLINRGADLRTVQEILGHASILSTQVYTRIVPVKGKRQNVELNQRDQIAVEPAARLPIRKKK